MLKEVFKKMGYLHVFLPFMQLCKSRFRKAESVLVKNEHIKFMEHIVIRTCTCFVGINFANV